MQIEGVVFIIITPVLLFTSRWLWRKKAIDRATCCWVCCRRSMSSPRCWCSCRSMGLSRSIWRSIPSGSALIVHIITVLIIAILRVRAENRQLEQKQRLARELRLSGEASFHQRQFMGMVAL
ncbi:hypothetical protein LNQ03_02045 [Klebsiella pneumoniae subsp. pneumoniae]|nr:hypothetical protein [Klebsiella pneumoniae subsp. pneumoniae]